jgi:hypothetical protein
MDYQVFLVGRMNEEWIHRRDSQCAANSWLPRWLDPSSGTWPWNPARNTSCAGLDLRK